MLTASSFALQLGDVTRFDEMPIVFVRAAKGRPVQAQVRPSFRFATRGGQAKWYTAWAQPISKAEGYCT